MIKFGISSNRAKISCFTSFASNAGLLVCYLIQDVSEIVITGSNMICCVSFCDYIELELGLILKFPENDVPKPLLYISWLHKPNWNALLKNSSVYVFTTWCMDPDLSLPVLVAEHFCCYNYQTNKRMKYFQLKPKRHSSSESSGLHGQYFIRLICSTSIQIIPYFVQPRAKIAAFYICSKYQKDAIVFSSIVNIVLSYYHMCIHARPCHAY